MSIFPFPKISMTIKDYLVSLIANKVSLYVANADSGTDTVEIDHASGIATFTSSLGGNTLGSYTINNSLITTGSCVIPVLNYDPISNSGKPVIRSVKIATGSITLYIENNSASATNANLVVQFILV